MTDKQYDFFYNGKPVKRSDMLNISETDNFDKFALSDKNKNGSLTVEMPNNMKRQWDMHDYQKRTGKPKSVYIPLPFPLENG